MRVAKVLLTTAGLASVAAVAFTASALATPASPTSVSRTQTWPHVQKEALTITGAKTHERASPSQGNLAIAPGVPVRVTVTNYTREYHTITIPGLHVSALIFPAHGTTPRTTTFTFTASEYGTFAWYCAYCTSAAHGQRHMMGGTIYAIINPSVLP
jgi:plastocyanin